MMLTRRCEKSPALGALAGISDLPTVVDTIPVSTVRTLAGASHGLVRLMADITKIDTF